MRPIHLTILFAVLAVAVLPQAAHAQSSTCYEFACDSYAVYDPVGNEISGYSRTVDYWWEGWYLFAESLLGDPNGETVADVYAGGYSEAEADVSYAPGPSGEYGVHGVHSYGLEDNIAYDGDSYYGDVWVAPPPVVSSPTGQLTWYSLDPTNPHSIEIIGTGFTDLPWIWGCDGGIDQSSWALNSSTDITGSLHVSTSLSSACTVDVWVAAVLAFTIALEPAAPPPPPTLTLQRTSLMEVLATGSPSGGGFAINITPGNGGSPVGLSLTSNITLQSDDFTFVDPPSSGAPSPGTLSAVNVTYTIQPGASTSDSFNVPTFGMSCYKISLESDFINAAGQCSNGLSTTNPPNITGTFCNAFLTDVITQGSGFSANGTAIQYDTNSGSFYFPQNNTPTGADGPLIAGQTVARNFSTIPRGQNWTVTVDGVGIGLMATDTGSRTRITKYRLDQFMGAGNNACANYPNLMGVAACTPGGADCPGSAIQ
jgi:hypothetical protein